MSGQIFISYRREESSAWAGRLYDRLAARFDRKQIFRDVDALPLGENFLKAIEKRVGECDVLIAVIGTHWLTSTDEQGGRRLDNSEDFVRMEIATALRRDIRVIPVLVNGALMPRSTGLPDDLKQLVYLHALQVGDTHFDDDCRRLVAAIEQVLEKTTPEQRERGLTSPGKKIWLSVAGVVTVLALVVVAAILYFGSQRPETKPTTPEVAVQPSARQATPKIEEEIPLSSLEPPPELTQEKSHSLQKELIKRIKNISDQQATDVLEQFAPPDFATLPEPKIRLQVLISNTSDFVTLSKMGEKIPQLPRLPTPQLPLLPTESTTRDVHGLQKLLIKGLGNISDQDATNILDQFAPPTFSKAGIPKIRLQVLISNTSDFVTLSKMGEKIPH